MARPQGTPRIPNHRPQHLRAERCGGFPAAGIIEGHGHEEEQTRISRKIFGHGRLSGPQRAPRRRMLCNKERSADRLGQQKTAISVTLRRTVNGQSREPNSRQSVRRVSSGVFLGKMLSTDFTERQREVPQDGDRMFGCRQDKSP